MRNRLKPNGFTLIELLVVIAIIGILSSIVLSSLNSARLKSLDAKVLQDMHNLRLALELYYADNGTYPALADPYSTVAVTTQNSAWITLLGTQLTPYISTIPRNPARSDFAGSYSYYNPRLTPGRDPFCLTNGVRAILINNGYYMTAILSNYPTPNLPKNINDSGIDDFRYEIIGGNLVNLPSGVCP